MPAKSKASVRSAARRSSSTPVPGVKRIVVPIDFSDSSKRALHYAGSMAEKFGATIIPLHVVEPVVYPSDMAFAPIAAELPTKVSVVAMRKKLENWCAGELAAGVMGKPVVRVGQPFHEIAEAARVLKADLVVISTHGYTGLKHVLLGSTAERVVRHTACPVLTVRRP